MKVIVIIITLLPFGLPQASFIKKYSGAYTIVASSMPSNESEAYALKPDGSAVWIYGWKDSSGRLQTQKKYGTWSAREGSITVSINGNTGRIVQVYNLENGKFVSVEDSRAYLRKK